MQKALESALSELILDADLELETPEAIDAWLSQHGVHGEDADAIRERELPRLLVYRRLIRSTLREALEVAIPRTIARLGLAFDAYFAAFLREVGPRSRYLRDVTREFLDYCAPLWQRDPAVPAYLRDLAEHEALHIEIAAAPPRALSHEPLPLDLEAGLAFSEAVRLMRFSHAVHRLSDDLADRSLPAQVLTDLFVYRSPEHEVRYLELTPVAAAILEHLLAGASLKQSLLTATHRHRVPLDEALITGTARLLADLAERGALIGARVAFDPAHSSSEANTSKLPLASPSPHHRPTSTKP